MARGLMERFSKLPPERKKLIAYGGLFLLICIVGYFLYTQKKPPKKKKEEIKFEEVVPEVSLLEKTLYEKTTLQTKKLEDEIRKLRAELEKTKSALIEARKKKEIPATISELESRIEELEKKLRTEKTAGKPPSAAGQRTERGFYGAQRQQRKPVKPSWVGGVGKAGKSEAPTGKSGKKTEAEKKAPGKKKEERTVYLPPSWVPGDLLTGFSAFTSKRGKKEPLRVMIRLRDLAVLPNEVKADLKGCYVIGEVYGNLADERAHVRLLRLSCISRDGTSVIDEEVKGWVNDEDGGVGLRGYVVTKMGAFLGRYMLAGFLEGFGEAYSESNYDVSVGGGEVVRLARPEEAAKAGLGKGIGKVGEGLSDFYLELAKQTLPVIQVGAGKRVTVVFSEGKDLRIRKKCFKGRDGCTEKKAEEGLYALAGY